ncbi:MAG: GNAT family N-acetyltransferase [Candidatus Zixiibacteriota bacterium]
MKNSNYYWQGKKVKLRAMEPKDVKIWLEEDEDSEAVRFLNYGMELPKHSKDAANFAENYSYFKNSDKRIMFTIENLEGKIVGGMNIHTIDRKNGTFGIGSRIYRKYRGHGYAIDAKKVILRYCFFEMRMHKYNAGCMANNDAIISHYKKLGLKQEGIRRESIYSEGKYIDELLFGLTKDEFIENEKSMYSKNNSR